MLVWIIVAMAAEAVRQYFAVDGAATFTFYGVNTIITEAAVLAAVGTLIFLP